MLFELFCNASELFKVVGVDVTDDTASKNRQKLRI